MENKVAILAAGKLLHFFSLRGVFKSSLLVNFLETVKIIKPLLKTEIVFQGVVTENCKTGIMVSTTKDGVMKNNLSICILVTPNNNIQLKNRLYSGSNEYTQKQKND